MRWLERVAAPLMVRPQSPTADLYFLNACSDLLAPHGPIERLAPGVFTTRDTALVVRHAGGGQPGLTEPGRPGGLLTRPRLFHLIDDDVAACVADPGLPPGHRLKLALFELRHARALAAVGAEPIVSSEPLAERMRAAGRRPRLLHPHWSEPLAAPVQRVDGPVRLGLLASAAHRADVAFLRPVLARVLDARPQSELHIAANHHLGPLRRHPQVRLIQATDWPAYRAWLVSARLDIGLYPLLPTPANRARSVNKLIEHAVAGAATLCSDSWPEADRVRRRGAGLVLPPDPMAWEQALLGLIDDPARTCALAAAGRRLAADLNRPDRQRRFWQHAFSLDGISEPSTPI